MKRNLSWLSKYRIVVYIILGTLLLGCGVFFAGMEWFDFPRLLSTSNLQLIALVVFDLLLIFTLTDIYFQSSQKHQSTLAWKLALVFTGINLIILGLLFCYYGLTSRAEIRSVAMVLRLVPYLAVILGGGFLVSLWKTAREGFRKGWNFISFEDDQYERRKALPFTVIILSVCFAAGLVLRFINLDRFPLYVDEYPHVRTALSLIHGEQPSYTRAYYLVTLPVYFSFRLFGAHEWAARLPMVIMNMLAIFPLYFLGKKINRFTGLASVVLFTVNPWIVSAARTVREYAIIPFFFFLSAIFLLDLFDFERSTVKLYFRRHLWKILVLLAIAAYILIDPYSNFKIILVNYVVFIVFLVFKFWKRIKSRKTKIIWAVIALLLAWGGLEITGIISHYIDIFFKDIGIQYWESLVSNSYRQWYYLLPSVGYLIITMILFFSVKFFLEAPQKSDTALSYCFVIFFAILIYLVFFLNEGAFLGMVRYGALLEYWYVLIVAAFFFIVYYLMRKFIRSRVLHVFLTIIIFLAFFINFPAFSAIYRFTGGIHPVTREGHLIIEPAYQMLIPQIGEDDVILSAQLTTYDEMHDDIFRNQRVIQYSNLVGDKFAAINDVIIRYPEGWIVLNVLSDLPEASFTVTDRMVDYLGKQGDMFIWHWYTRQ